MRVNLPQPPRFDDMGSVRRSLSTHLARIQQEIEQSSTHVLDNRADIDVRNSLNVQGDLTIATKTPSSASDTGTTGTIAWDSSYIYICTATDTWKRVAISTW